MHSFSKLSNVGEKINFLERKLFNHSQIIEELETELKKIKFTPNKSLKQLRKPFILNSSVKQRKGIFLLLVVLTFRANGV